MGLLKVLPVFAFWTTMVAAHSTSAFVARQPAQPVPAVANENSLKPKSFREWKNERVESASLRLEALQLKMKSLKASRAIAKTEAGLGGDIQIERLQAQLDQAHFSLDLAKDLSVTDYFVGYLTKMEDRKGAISAVAGKLSAEEVAELMNAYANSFFGSSGAAASCEASKSDENLK